MYIFEPSEHTARDKCCVPVHKSSFQRTITSAGPHGATYFIYVLKYKTTCKPHFFVKNDVIDLALNDPDPDPCRFLFPEPPFTITGRSLVRWI